MLLGTIRNGRMGVLFEVRTWDVRASNIDRCGIEDCEEQAIGALLVKDPEMCFDESPVPLCSAHADALKG